MTMEALLNHPTYIQAVEMHRKRYTKKSKKAGKVPYVKYFMSNLFCLFFSVPLSDDTALSSYPDLQGLI